MCPTFSLLAPLWFDSLPSTNRWLKEQLQAGQPLAPGTAVAARVQTAARGRKDRVWETGTGNLACSFYMKSSRPTAELSSLSMACALAVADVLDDLGLDARLKWPNDVLVNGKKICGILAEIVRSVPPSAYLVVGIGLNLALNNRECAAIGRPATSVLLETGCLLEPADIFNRLRPELDRTVGQWEEKGFSALRARWLERAYRLGDTVSIDIEGTTRHGVFTDIGATGELVIARNGITESLVVGEFDR